MFMVANVAREHLLEEPDPIELRKSVAAALLLLPKNVESRFADRRIAALAQCGDQRRLSGSRGARDDMKAQTVQSIAYVVGARRIVGLLCVFALVAQEFSGNRIRRPPASEVHSRTRLTPYRLVGTLTTSVSCT